LAPSAAVQKRMSGRRGTRGKNNPAGLPPEFYIPEG
jgi:hypothetical protein